MTPENAGRLYVLLGIALLGLGSYALVHPEYARGGGLALLGLAALERGSRRTKRMFRSVSDAFDDQPRWRPRGRRVKPARPVPVRPRSGWQPAV